MTRINIISPSELSDQHLIAEYRELPRCIRNNINISDASDKYILGKGHVKWAKKHSTYLFIRYNQIIKEMIYRGFSAKYSILELLKYRDFSWKERVYNPTIEDILLSQNRIKLKYRQKPNWYRWTNREKPKWLK